MEIINIIEEAVKELGIQGVSLSSFKNLRIVWKVFLMHFLEQGIRWDEVSLDNVKEYQNYMLKIYRRETVRMRMHSIKSFYHAMKSLKKIARNPFDGVVIVKRIKSVVSVVKEHEMEKILDYFCDWEKGCNYYRRARLYRLHVIGELMYASGLRVNEVQLLELENLDLRRGIIRVTKGKGGQERVAYLNEYALNVIKIYIEKIRPILEPSNSAHLFVFPVKSHLDLMLKKVCLKESLPKISTHGFRHALGYHLLRAGCGIRYIQEILGHKKLHTTEVYTKVDQESLVKMIEKYHPR